MLLTESGFFEALLQRVRRPCEWLFARFGIPVADRDDLLQDCLLALCAHPRAEIRDPDCYFLAAVRNRCRDFHRNRLRRFDVTLDETILATLADKSVPSAERTFLHRDLAAALARVPKRCREILALRYNQDLSAAETADRLGYSPNSMKKITTRCLRAAHEALLDLWGGEPGRRTHEPESPSSEPLASRLES